MGLFLGYFCKRIFTFFRKHESPKKVKGTVHASRHVFKMSNNSGSTKHIKMIEMLKYCLSCAICDQDFYDVPSTSRSHSCRRIKRLPNLSVSLIYIASRHAFKTRTSDISDSTTRSKQQAERNRYVFFNLLILQEIHQRY